MIQSRQVSWGIVLLMTFPFIVVPAAAQQASEPASSSTAIDQRQESDKDKQAKDKQAVSKNGAENKAAVDQKPQLRKNQKDAGEKIAANPEAKGVKLVVVVGADGEKVYGEQFSVWAERWRSIANKNEIDFTLIRGKEQDAETDRQRFKEVIEATKGHAALWLVLIGHGTDDRKQSKFNLIGPDVTARELDGWLARIECPVAVINCASCSGAFIAKLKAKNRVVVSSTRSGAQYNFSRFGNYLSLAIADPSLDLDKDQQTSLLEAFIAASQRTQDYYDQEKRLASELALIDDNGDGLGTPGDWFAGSRVVKRSADAKVKPDGRFASRLVLVPNELEASLTIEQRKERDRLEAELEQLRDNKADMEESAYFAKLEVVMLQLAKIYESD